MRLHKSLPGLTSSKMSRSPTPWTLACYVCILTMKATPHQGPPESTPHTAGKFNPPMLDMAIPTPTLACPQPLQCAPAPQPRWPSLSAKLHRLLLCPITRPPPPPPPRYSNPAFPLLHIYLPPIRTPIWGFYYFLYFIPHILLTLYKTLHTYMGSHCHILVMSSTLCVVLVLDIWFQPKAD